MIKFIIDLLSPTSNISNMRFNQTICSITACVISIYVSIVGTTNQDIALITVLLGIVTYGKVKQKEIENSNE